MTHGIRLLLVSIMVSTTLSARVRIPADAPYCAPPGTAQLFVSPMGEPFRAPAGAPDPAGTWFAGADTDRDGQVSRAELQADARRFFGTLDRDGDGRLVPAEIAAYERQVAPEIALYRGRGGLEEPRRGSGGRNADYGGPMGAGRFGWLNIPEPVASADADTDRVVTLAEFLAAADRRYDTLAQAGGGRLTLAGQPMTYARQAIAGPCWPRPKRKRTDDGIDAPIGPNDDGKDRR